LTQTTPDKAPTPNLSKLIPKYVIKFEQPNKNDNNKHNPHTITNTIPHTITNTTPTQQKQPPHNNKHNPHTTTKTTPTQQQTQPPHNNKHNPHTTTNTTPTQ